MIATTTTPETMDVFEFAATGTLWFDRWYDLLSGELFAPIATQATALLADTAFLRDIQDELDHLANTPEKAAIIYESLQLAATVLATGATRDAAGFTVAGGCVVTYWRPA